MVIHKTVAPAPTLTGPLPISATSMPMTTCMDPATNRGIDFRQRGYTEDEYLIEGTASAYDGNGTVVQPAVPYTTRIVVRRPHDHSQFSGTVHLEPFHMAAEGNVAWLFFNEHWTRSGDAWVGVTVHPGGLGPKIGWPSGVKLLKELDAGRYGELNLYEALPDVLTLDMADLPQVRERVAQCYPQAADVVTQIANLFKTNTSTHLFGGGLVERIYASGCSQTGAFWAQFIDNGHADRARSADGRPSFDAYFIAVAPGPTRRPTDSAVVAVLSESELTGSMGFGRIEPSAPDTDQPRFRAYEVPGSWHGWLNFHNFRNRETPWWGQLISRGYPHAELLPALTAGEPHLDGSQPVAHTDRPFHLLANALWDGLDRWVCYDEPMPQTERAERDPSGTARDELGNLRGGVRLPWIQVPTARYAGSCTCSAAVGRMWPLDQPQLSAMYPGTDELSERFTTAAETTVRQRLLTPADAKVVLSEPH